MAITDSMHFTLNQTKPTDWTHTLISALPLGIPIVVFIIHSATLRNWIVDDAGISFAYAKNLAHGFGLVSQPGRPPVEGYSNFLWTVLFSPFMYLHLFDPLVTPKLISVVLVILAFFTVYKGCLLLPDGKAIAGVALMLIALNTPFVIWTNSGLENPLYVFLVVLLVFGCLREFSYGQPVLWRPVFLAVLASAIAMTRPDGILYAGIYPVLRLIIGRRKHSAILANLSSYVLTFVVVFGVFLAFRWVYYGDILPNTYYAKTGFPIDYLKHTLTMLTFQPPMVNELRNLAASVAGPFGDAALVAWIVMMVGILISKRFARGHLVLFTFLVVALFIHLLLPPDWMAEYRFATPFFVLLYLQAGMLIDAFLQTLKLKAGSASLRLALAGAAIVGSVFIYIPRTLAFEKEPTLSFDSVAKMVSRFDDYAGQLKIQDGSVLLPDIGGTLYYSRLEVYDVPGLIDKTIARTFLQDPAAFHNYVFGVIKPTFINLHDSWTYKSQLSQDQRFRRDYMPICEYVDPWVRDTLKLEMYSGDYVRKDVVKENPELLDAIHSQLHEGCTPNT
jgi:hypothetical protein